MLVLSRKVGEEIVINDDIRVTVVAIRGERARLGISAPRETVVDRREIHETRIDQRRAAKPPPHGEVAV
jgi:carbon storage regulator